MLGWDKVAKVRGYVDTKAMLVDLYTERKLSANEIGKEIGASLSSVCLKIKEVGIKPRPRGGNNYKKKPDLRHYSYNSKSFRKNSPLIKRAANG